MLDEVAAPFNYLVDQILADEERRQYPQIKSARSVSSN